MPITPKASRAAIVYSTVRNSLIWPTLITLKLTKNMRIESLANLTEGAEMQRFSDWLLRIGNGLEGKFAKETEGY